MARENKEQIISYVLKLISAGDEDLVKKSRANETIMYVDALVEFEG